MPQCGCCGKNLNRYNESSNGGICKECQAKIDEQEDKQDNDKKDDKKDDKR